MKTGQKTQSKVVHARAASSISQAIDIFLLDSLLAEAESFHQVSAAAHAPAAEPSLQALAKSVDRKHLACGRRRGRHAHPDAKDVLQDEVLSLTRATEFARETMAEEARVRSLQEATLNLPAKQRTTKGSRDTV